MMKSLLLTRVSLLVFVLILLNFCVSNVVKILIVIDFACII